jgi:3-deoxy-D-manno-octulosonate 8-phosphate phosphatase KdsC-like HAD superfamily phosphatase
MIIISGEKNNVVLQRSRKLKIECYYGIDNKEEIMQKVVKEFGYNYSNVAYIGNNINDLCCMKLVGVPLL